MIGSENNLGSISLAVLLHVVLLATMVLGFHFERPMPPTPMTIVAQLVPEDSVIPQRPVVEKKPEEEPETPAVVEPPKPEPKPEPKPPEPEPDNSQELRRQAEKEKREADALREEQRLETIRQQELAENKRKEREAAERKKREQAEREKRDEAEKERKRLEAERQREADVKRQREENERIQRELEADQRQQAIEDEERLTRAMNSPAMAAYQFAIRQKIRRNWSVPASATSDTVCVARVRQLASGEVVGVNITRCNGDDAVKRSVEAAIRRSSPLPRPSDPDLFVADLELNLRPEQ